jgi:tRNA A37 methylthiotransferase MiaB
MKTITNRFGTGDLYNIWDVVFDSNRTYVECTACMSVWSDFLSWANNEENDEKYLTTSIRDAENIIILGCQVTDLAIYNDLRRAEELYQEHKNYIYMGGCLAQRFDIELPYYVKRLDVVRKPYQDIWDKECIVYQKPFWVTKLEDGEYSQGNLFRNMYPLKIGAGCHGKCKYCTIRDTRGETYETDAFLQVQEFLNHDDVVLISDSPSVKQIRDWCLIAERYNKALSFRNIEPQNAVAAYADLAMLASNKLLKILHVPIQSEKEEIIKAMNRNWELTRQYIEYSQYLRDKGVKVATNIIIDYDVNDKVYHNMDKEWLDSYFDYWTWNPYFDGNWDYQKAKERFNKYIKCD